MSAVMKSKLLDTMEVYLEGHMLGVLRRVERSCAFLHYCRGAGYLRAYFNGIRRGTACPFEHAHAQLEFALFRLLHTQPLLLLECQYSYEAIDREVRSVAVPVPLLTFKEATLSIQRDRDCPTMMTAGGVHEALGKLLAAASASMRYLHRVDQVLRANHSVEGGEGQRVLREGEYVKVVPEFLQAAKHAIELMMEAGSTIKDEEEE